MTEILKRPVVTEKMTEIGEKLNCYGFIVANKANKIQIRNAVEEVYGVSVKKVRTMTCVGKYGLNRTAFGITKGRKGSYKKAIVTLEEGDTIDFYSNV
jgi:large subunit ribosomal protein L23